MTTTSARRDQIISSLQDKEYRDLFVSEEIDTGLPLQIRELRSDREWSQRELAGRTGMTQEGVSRLERLDYGKYTLTTLKRLAAAFDVALVVRFEPYSRLVDWVSNLSPEDMAVPDFEHDAGLTRNSQYTGVAATSERLSKQWVTATGKILHLVPSLDAQPESFAIDQDTTAKSFQYQKAPVSNTATARPAGGDFFSAVAD